MPYGDKTQNFLILNLVVREVRVGSKRQNLRKNCICNTPMDKSVHDVSYICHKLFEDVKTLLSLQVSRSADRY
jgi:hypothetical protein